MIITKVEIVGNRILKINGDRVNWANPSDLYMFGTEEDTLEEKARLLVEFRDNNGEFTELRRQRVNKLAREYTRTLDPKEHNVYLLKKLLENKVKYYSKLYGKITRLEKEDIKQELILLIIEKFREMEDKYGIDSNEAYIYTANYFREYSHTDIIYAIRNAAGLSYISAEKFKDIVKTAEKAEELAGNLADNLDKEVDIREELEIELNVPLHIIDERLNTYDKICNISDDKIINNSIIDEKLYNRVDCTGLNDELLKVTKTLTPREQLVLQLRFGIDLGMVKNHTGHEYTLEYIGKIIWVSKDRVRQIEQKALRKLRHPSRCRQLEDYTDYHCRKYKDTSNVTVTDNCGCRYTPIKYNNNGELMYVNHGAKIKEISTNNRQFLDIDRLQYENGYITTLRIINKQCKFSAESVLIGHYNEVVGIVLKPYLGSKELDKICVDKKAFRHLVLIGLVTNIINFPGDDLCKLILDDYTSIPRYSYRNETIIKDYDIKNLKIKQAVTSKITDVA